MHEGPLFSTFFLTLRENSDPVSHKALFSVPPWSQHLAMEHLGPATHPSLRSITCPAGRKPMTKKEDSRPWLQRNDEMRRNPLRGKSTVGLKQTLGEQWVRGADDNGCRHAVPGATSWRTILRYAMSVTPWGCVTWGTLGRPPPRWHILITNMVPKLPSGQGGFPGITEPQEFADSDPGKGAHAFA